MSDTKQVSFPITHNIAEPGDIQRLITRLLSSPDNHLSTLLMDKFRGHKFTDLNEFIKIQSLIEELGWIEHTGDWDLSITITTKTGTLETDPGYSVIQIQGDDILIEDDIDSGGQVDGDSAYHTFPISQIISISLTDH
jgi:hypothetical protein